MFFPSTIARAGSPTSPKCPGKAFPVRLLLVTSKKLHKDFKGGGAYSGIVFAPAKKKSCMETRSAIDERLTSGKHVSFWTDSVKPLFYHSLRENIETDVAIVGGGIAGLSVAYCLVQAGKQVVVIEDGGIGSGESGRTTAHLVNALDDRYYELERIYGEEGARLAAQSHTVAIDFIERVIEHEHINCEFRRLSGYLFLHPSDPQASLEKEFISASKAGVDVVMQQEIPGLRHSANACIEFRNQAQFHPLKYLHGLCKAITEKSGLIFTDTRAKEVNSHGIITESGHIVYAGHVVVATNVPVNNKYIMHVKQFAYRTYVIAALIKKGTLPWALWWDTGNMNTNPSIPPYHYVRLQSYNDEYDLLIAGGEDHPSGMATAAENISEQQRYSLLEEWTREHFPIGDIVCRWSGEVREPMDSLAYIGHNPLDSENIYIVCGDSGNGLTHGTIAGLLITDLIQGKQNDWEKLYHPSRFKIFKSGKTFFKEFIGGLTTYLRSSPRHAEVAQLSSIPAGEAKLIELDGDKYGAYRDENGDLHLVTAECTHLKCIIQWNNDEKSWDCPCHGSRFSYEGKVLNGPANTDLLYFREQATETAPFTAGKNSAAWPTDVRPQH